MLTRLITLGRRPTLKQSVRYGIAEVFSRYSPYSAPDIYGWLGRKGVSTEDVMAAIEMAPAQNLKPSDILEELLAKRRKPKFIEKLPGPEIVQDEAGPLSLG